METALMEHRLRQCRILLAEAQGVAESRPELFTPQLRTLLAETVSHLECVLAGVISTRPPCDV